MYNNSEELIHYNGKILKGNQFIMKYEQATVDAYTEDRKR